MIGVRIQCFAKLGDCLVAMAYNVIVDLLVLYPLGGLEVDRGYAQTAVEIALVGLECR